jgi:hypothetical protein
MIEKIGETTVLLPELIMRGLAASDRVKYYLALLQAAYAHAYTPDEPPATLRLEREASGVEDVSLDHVVEATTLRGDDTVYVPTAAAIVASLFEESRRMLQPLVVAGAMETDLRGRTDIYQRRLGDLFAHAPIAADDLLTKSTMRVLTKLSGNGHDTLHQLANDLRWELNRLQASVNMETLDGASVYGLVSSERALVRAFMKGVNETAKLKLDHPGLATTAAHEGDRLTIHNTLSGTRDHALVLHVAELSATITYVDVHRQRLRFFREMLQPHDIHWQSQTPPPSGADVETATGQYVAETREQLGAFLAFVGSRLVFLIQWNRARKRLTQLVGKADAISLLKWAADNNIGHMGFLRAGDVQLVEDAFERAMSLEMRPGIRLDRWLRAGAARSFLMSVLLTTSLGISAGHSLSLIEDEIEAELLRYLQTPGRQLLGDAANHAVALSALDDSVRATLIRLNAGESLDGAARATEVAASWSSKAHQIIRHAGRSLNSGDSTHQLRPLLAEADVAVAALEEVVFLLSVISGSIDRKLIPQLSALAHLVGGAVREYVSCLDESRDLSTASDRGDVESFLLRVDRLAELARQTHSAKRALTEKLLRASADFHEVFVVSSLAQEFERAAMALSRCGPIARDYVLRTCFTR